MKSGILPHKILNRTADLFKAGSTAFIPYMPRSAEAAVLWAMSNSLNATIVWISEGRHSLELMHRDMLSISQGQNDFLLFYPPSETSSKGKDDPDISGQRLDVLVKMGEASNSESIHHSRHYVITTSIQALMQKGIDPETLSRQAIFLSIGKEYDLDAIIGQLNRAGYSFTPEVQEKCTAALKGGLLDIWPSTETWPIRIEYSGSTIESMRIFDPASQKSMGRIDRMLIPPAIDSLHAGSDGKSLLAHLPPDTIFVWSNPESIREHSKLYEETSVEPHIADHIIPVETIESTINRIHGVRQVYVGSTKDSNIGEAGDDFPEFSPVESVCRFRPEMFQPDIMEQARRKLLSGLHEKAASGWTVFLFLDTPGSLEHHQALLKENNFSNIITRTGALSEGFICHYCKIIVVAESDLYGTRKANSRRYDPTPGKNAPDKITGMRVSDLTDIEPGDLVVHADHGIGKYRGLNEIKVNGQLQEVLSIEYADKAKLHVPVSQAHLLSRYVGISRHSVKLHSLGGKGWSKDKAAAQRSIEDLAASLLETQAHRSLQEGVSTAPDTRWQYEFEASFPYIETQDQQKVIAEVKNDLESRRPMDRLVCGDAGYGKTEVAMRAAFKMVMDERQVAVLVPTTVLAQQHFDTFSERMAPYPVRIEMLSRFCSHTRHEKTLSALADGSVDIVIGTHSLLQAGITFKNLGLVIVDEEQRFGVTHKEKFKQMRQMVDVLTLTATPIPRTLYMSMTGARDMSLLQTPPRERMAIETLVAKNTDDVIREAVLREINRDGQVFYLHNRVMTIDRVRQRLEQIVPEAKIAVAHGQMASGELAAVMKAFVDGECNLLLCTTIIESGVDIPRANTILIDRADRFGMADLYQLRGRVGRSSHKGYAYLLIPPHGYIDFDARKRIGAVKKYSGLSAGFNIALRDLEIRGAGNILGAEQSGHISAIGFGLYCQLLRRSVAQLKKEPVPPIIDVDLMLDFIRLTSDSSVTDNSAVIPYEYIEDERLRVAIYRRIAESAIQAEITTLRAECRDRFGKVPPPLERLFKMAEIRITCATHNISSLEVRDGKVMMKRNKDYIMRRNHFPRLNSTNPDKTLDEIITIINSFRHD